MDGWTDDERMDELVTEWMDEFRGSFMNPLGFNSMTMCVTSLPLTCTLLCALHMFKANIERNIIEKVKKKKKSIKRKGRMLTIPKITTHIILLTLT